MLAASHAASHAAAHSASHAALLALGVIVVLIMPGPTNTLLASAGLKDGVKRSIRLTGAELAGYVTSITLWGLFLTRTAHSVPWLPGVVRIASSVYIAWLAWRMWRAAVALPSSTQRAIGMRTLFVATLLNPKAILFAGSLFPSAAFAERTVYLESMAIFAALLVPIGMLWVAFGAALGSGRQTWISPFQMQRGASVVLGVFAVTLAWTAIRLVV